MLFLYIYRNKQNFGSSIDVSHYQKMFNELQLVFDAVNRRVFNTRKLIPIMFFERATCAYFAYISFQLTKSSLNVGNEFVRFTAIFICLSYSILTSNFQLEFSKLACFLTEDSKQFKNSYRYNTKLRLSKKVRLFIKSCPNFLLKFGGVVLVTRDAYLKFTQEFTLNILITLLLNYR